MRPGPSTPSSICSASDPDKLENFRGYKGAQSYPSPPRSTTSIFHRLGRARLAQTLFSSLVQDYVSAHGWMKDRPEGG